MGRARPLENRRARRKHAQEPGAVLGRVLRHPGAGTPQTDPRHSRIRKLLLVSEERFALRRELGEPNREVILALPLVAQLDKLTLLQVVEEKQRSGQGQAKRLK